MCHHRLRHGTLWDREAQWVRFELLNRWTRSRTSSKHDALQLIVPLAAPNAAPLHSENSRLLCRTSSICWRTCKLCAGCHLINKCVLNAIYSLRKRLMLMYSHTVNFVLKIVSCHRATLFLNMKRLQFQEMKPAEHRTLCVRTRAGKTLVRGVPCWGETKRRQAAKKKTFIPPTHCAFLFHFVSLSFFTLLARKLLAVHSSRYVRCK